MTSLPIRADIAEARRRLWEHVAAPGSWWSGAERVAAVAEARRATTCGLCRERKTALSPAAVAGQHDADNVLPVAAIEVAHKLRTDSGRLSPQWYAAQRDAGLSDGQYVELVGVVTMATGMEMFQRALGTPLDALPVPEAGSPRHDRPPGAKLNGAWVPTVAEADVTEAEADFYPPGAMIPNIATALSLVPREVRMLRTLSSAFYMPIERVADPTFRRGPLDRMQMELVAARVSAMNECFY